MKLNGQGAPMAIRLKPHYAYLGYCQSTILFIVRGWTPIVYINEESLAGDIGDG